MQYLGHVRDRITFYSFMKSNIPKEGIDSGNGKCTGKRRPS